MKIDINFDMVQNVVEMDKEKSFAALIKYSKERKKKLEKEQI